MEGVCEYFAELGKAPRPCPPGPQSFVCQGHNGDLQNACPGTTAGERVAEGARAACGAGERQTFSKESAACGGTNGVASENWALALAWASLRSLE